MQTVVETPEFLVAAKKAGMTDEERVAAVDVIAANPSAGTVIPGTGGCRKVRIAREGGGKSGGYRVVTYFTTTHAPVFLLTVISKGKRANLTKSQRNELRKGSDDGQWRFRKPQARLG
jgi:hypothetical protein